MAGSSIDGLVSGLDTSEVIASLMAVERQPLTRIQAQRTAFQAASTAWDDIAAKLAAVRAATDPLATAARLRPAAATSNDPTVLSVTAREGAAPGTLTLRVDALAAAHQVASAGFASATSTVGAGTLTIGGGLAALGFTGVRAASGLAPGQHAVAVTRGSSAASATGTALGFPVTIGAGATIELNAGGTPVVATVAAGTYESAAALATAVDAALAGTGVGATAGGGALKLATTAHGSAATLAITGGGALGALGLSPSTSAGADAIVNVGGTDYAVAPGATVEAGGLTLVAGATLAAGTGGATVVHTTATTTVSDLARLVATAGGPASATVIDVGAGDAPARLVFAATATGTANALLVDATGIAGLAGGFTELRAAANATVTIGSGPGALTVTRPGNSISDLVPGLTVNLAQAVPGRDVTIGVTRDDDAIVAQAKKLVDALNAALTALRNHTSYDAKTGRRGALGSDSAARGLANSLYAALRATNGDGTVRTLSQAGISLGDGGSVRFDEQSLRRALATDAEGVTRLLARTASSTDSRVRFVTAGHQARPGSYDVVVTQAAERGGVTGTAFGALAAAETISVRWQGTTATYTAAAGSDAHAVAAGLNTVLAQARLGVRALVTDGAVRLETTAYGSAASVETMSSGSGTGLGGAAWSAYAGVDAAGTVGGVAATGAGQSLVTADGLSLATTATAAEVAAAGGSLALGAVTYQAGAAASLASALARAVAATGAVASGRDSAQSGIARLDDRIDAWTERLSAKEERLRRQFATLERTLGQLRGLSGSLTSQLNR